MSAANDPTGSATPQTTETSPSPGPPQESIPLPTPPAPPPPRKQTTPERLAAEIARLDAVLAVVVLALAFLAASFAARNSDLWMNLAVGRLIATGQYPWG